ncbi:MAG: YgaP family membrane protein [bacterium]
MSIANVGSIDRVIRFIGGAGLVSVPFWSSVELSSLPGIAAIIVGAVFLVTSLISFCPLYSLIGFRTRPRD